MKPKPFSALNHLTVPLAMLVPLSRCQEPHRAALEVSPWSGTAQQSARAKARAGTANHDIRQ
ncbi:predicted protein [Streptomyces viridosporus ATCC 14672]|uniref:Predicted protein n=1 Tax=Streptomyces viridosporus (strain ATCC 14672 / DSM 40746 / JCM 4963 / KCTC 9882 / NRRL B-12104 / FH 1290) TaxID=566461 RepID=D5ZVP3_STRV1|nr:predicted protein [Streptomyces viridosporus ATCC 14672]